MPGKALVCRRQHFGAGRPWEARAQRDRDIRGGGIVLRPGGCACRSRGASAGAGGQTRWRSGKGARFLAHLGTAGGSGRKRRFTGSSKQRLGNGSGNAIRRTGRFWRPHWRLAARSGQKTLISSDAGLPHGPRAAYKRICAAIRSSPECRGSESGRRSIGPADCPMESRRA